MRRIAVLDAPSNLGLRPPTLTSVPGCAKAPGSLRDHDLIARLGARDAGCLTPPRYDPGDWRPGDGVCHAGSIAAYSTALAERIGSIIDLGEFPVVLGGDCSILLGSALAMHRLGEAVGGRIGLVFVDGHSDFRHPGNASYVGAAAGEDLALVTGRGQADLAAIEGRRPYFRDIDVVVLGIRAQDEYRLDLQAAGIVTRPVPPLRAEGAARTAQWAHDQLADCAGYWVHVDVDVLDPAVMPAVDAPEPGGIAFAELELLLAGLVDTPHCLGVELTVFDPDYDPDGAYAAEIVGTLVAGLAPVMEPAAAPPRLLPTQPDPAARVAATSDAGGMADAGGRAGTAGANAAGGLRPGGLRPGGLRPGNLQPGGLQPGSLRPGGPQSGGLRPGGPQSAALRPGGPQSGGLRPGGLAPRAALLVSVTEPTAPTPASDEARPADPAPAVAPAEAVTPAAPPAPTVAIAPTVAVAPTVRPARAPAPAADPGTDSPRTTAPGPATSSDPDTPDAAAVLGSAAGPGSLIRVDPPPTPPDNTESTADIA